MSRRLSASTELPPVVILATGEGTRLSSSMARPLVPVLGQTLIERILRGCATAGVREFVFVVEYMEEEMRAHLGALKEGLGVSATCVHAED